MTWWDRVEQEQFEEELAAQDVWPEFKDFGWMDHELNQKWWSDEQPNWWEEQEEVVEASTEDFEQMMEAPIMGADPSTWSPIAEPVEEAMMDFPIMDFDWMDEPMTEEMPEMEVAEEDSAPWWLDETPEMPEMPNMEESEEETGFPDMEFDWM